MFVGIVVTSMLVTGCSKSTTNENNTAGKVQDSAGSLSQTEGRDHNTTKVTDLTQYLAAEDVAYSTEDTYTEYDKASTTTITLEGSSATVNGAGATVTDGIVSINEAGCYVISGELTDGQIFVEEDNKGMVRLILNGVTIHSSNSAPIYIKNAGKTIISLEEGTQNVLSDGTNYVYTDVAEEEPNAVLFSKDSLTINGSGSLVVEGNFNNGISSKDVLKFMSGTIQVTAVNNGIVGRDALIVKTADITVNSGGDGLKTSNDTDASKGLLMIEDGSFRVTSGEDAMQAETAMIVKDGNFTLLSGGGSTQTVNDDVSMKGIKASSILSIDNGTFVIDSCDDSIHSNNDIIINGGSFQLTSGDDGIHADAQLDLNAGDITITKSYEGIEALTMNLAGANINVVASDDGINIAGGQDSSSLGGRPGMNQFSAGNGTLTIQAGIIYVDASGDGIDVNGSASMTGGEVYVSGPTNNGNAALDYDGKFTVSGGVMYAVGSSGMAQAPSTDSSQASILVNTDSSYQANAKIEIKDKDGTLIGTFTVKKRFNSIVFTSPDLTLDGTYNLSVDGVVVATLELTQTVTTSGEVGRGGFNKGGPGGFGGGKQGGFGGERPDGFNGEMPDFNGEMPDFNGEIPEFNGEMPDFNGEMPDFNGEVPDFNGEVSDGANNQTSGN